LIKKDLKRMVLPLAIMICLSAMPFLAQPAQAANPAPFFSISILAPNTNSARNQWSTLMVEQLPKIGIGIDVFDHTGWSQISPRTWGHPGPYPIPTYAEGGFDILFVGWSWGLDWDPTGLFDSPSMPPNGDNFYQYDSQDMDWAIYNYTSSFVLNDRIAWAEEIQALLYEDNPSACIIYPYSNYIHDTNFEGWDGLLWASSYQPMENWSIAGQTEFHYATPADFEDFHIYKYESVYDAQWLSQIYNPLIARDPTDPDYAYAPRLATSYSSTDGLTYNIIIDDDATWADGTDLTADDVEFSYMLQIDPDFGNPDQAFWEQYLDGTSIVINGPKDVDITFLQEYVFQEGNLALDLVPEHIWGAILPEDMETQAVTWATSDPNKLMGAGPYYLEEYDGTNGVIHLVANPYFVDWYDADPIFDDIYFEFYSNKDGALSDLASGALDMVDSQFSVQLDEIPTGTVNTLVNDPGTQEMAFNCEHPYLGTGELCPIPGWESGKNIRKAISSMIPREVIVDEILGGLGRPGVTGCPSVAIGFDESLEPYEYSIALAKSYMEAAGFEYVIPTSTTGLGLYVVIGILALAGASQVIFLKRRK
jgi:ABC-type transport system substrate-binding protein